MAIEAQSQRHTTAQQTRPKRKKRRQRKAETLVDSDADIMVESMGKFSLIAEKSESASVVEDDQINIAVKQENHDLACYDEDVKIDVQHKDENEDQNKDNSSVELSSISRSDTYSSTHTNYVMTPADKQEMYEIVKRGDIDRLEELMDSPVANVNLIWYGENLLMAAIRSRQEDMAHFLIDNGIDCNFETTSFDPEIDSNENLQRLDWCTVSCRQMAYEAEMWDIVQKIDQQNGDLFPFIMLRERAIRLWKPYDERMQDNFERGSEISSCHCSEVHSEAEFADVENSDDEGSKPKHACRIHRTIEHLNDEITEAADLSNEVKNLKSDIPFAKELAEDFKPLSSTSITNDLLASEVGISSISKKVEGDISSRCCQFNQNMSVANWRLHVAQPDNDQGVLTTPCNDEAFIFNSTRESKSEIKYFETKASLLRRRLKSRKEPIINVRHVQHLNRNNAPIITTDFHEEHQRERHVRIPVPVSKQPNINKSVFITERRINDKVRLNSPWKSDSGLSNANRWRPTSAQTPTSRLNAVRPKSSKTSFSTPAYFNSNTRSRMEASCFRQSNYLPPLARVRHRSHIL